MCTHIIYLYATKSINLKIIIIEKIIIFVYLVLVGCNVFLFLIALSVL